MSLRALFALASALAIAPASAHYNFDRLIVNGQRTEPYEYVRALPPTTGNGPMHNVNDPDIRCNVGSFAAAANTKTMQVKAGDNVGFNINSVLGHDGPLFAYMSKSTAADVSAYEGDGDWFKIYEMGVRTFANYQVAMTWITNGWTEFNFTIPTEIEDGQYLLRAEHIATHSAGAGEGAQFYVGCAQIEVTGGTGAKPSPVGKFPGIYGMRDPGIYFNPYWPPVVNYTMPGLKVYPEGGSFPDFTADPNLPAATQPLPPSAGGPRPTQAPVNSVPAVASPPAVSSAVVSVPAVSSPLAIASTTRAVSSSLAVIVAAASSSSQGGVGLPVASTRSVAASATASLTRGTCRLRKRRQERARRV